MNKREWQYGYSCEFLSPRDILNEGVPALMEEFDFGLFLKLTPRDLNKDLKELLQDLQDRGIYDHFYPWPLLSLRDGYYPNEKTIGRFTILVKTIMKWYSDNNFPPPPQVLVDIEPSPQNNQNFTQAEAEQAKWRLSGKRLYETVEQKVHNKAARETTGEKKSSGGARNVLSFVGKIVDQIDENVNERRYAENVSKFSELVDVIHGLGTKALAVTPPYIFDDLADGRHLIQNFMTTPIYGVDWDLVNYMTFATDFVYGTKGIISHDEFCHLCYLYCQDWVKYHGRDKASICFGITSFGHARAQLDPELYKREFNAAIAAGVDKLGIYCLEGILILGPERCRHFLEVVGSANGTFEVDAEKLEFAKMIRRLFEGIDYIAPVLYYLVKSGKIMQIIQSLTGNLKI